MKATILAAATLALAIAAPAHAISSVDTARGGATTSLRLPPYLQCVPYARQLTGIRIFGDAHTWWGQAAGRYARGRMPKVGAVMNFRPSGNSTLGHVAAVSRIIDSRTILISHANWSPINGRRGQIENNVRAVDVSPRNDWSEVRVWFGPTQSLGATRWPLYGFIYPHKPGARDHRSKTSQLAENLPSGSYGLDRMGEIIREARARQIARSAPSAGTARRTR